MDQETPSHAQRSRRPRRPRTLEFITFTNPEQARTATIRQRVRSQAMRDVHGRVEVPLRRRKNEIELDITPLLQTPAQDRWAGWNAEQSRAADEWTTPSVITPLGVSRVDPFFQYPIIMNHRERELCDHRK